MQVEQFVMAYQVEHDRLRAMIPEGFSSLRPVLRINGEILDNVCGYLEFNTPVEKEEFRGWLNIAFWENIPFVRKGNTLTMKMNHEGYQSTYKKLVVRYGERARGLVFNKEMEITL